MNEGSSSYREQCKYKDRSEVYKAHLPLRHNWTQISVDSTTSSHPIWKPQRTAGQHPSESQKSKSHQTTDRPPCLLEIWHKCDSLHICCRSSRLCRFWTDKQARTDLCAWMCICPSTFLYPHSFWQAAICLETEPSWSISRYVKPVA